VEDGVDASRDALETDASEAPDAGRPEPRIVPDVRADLAGETLFRGEAARFAEAEAERVAVADDDRLPLAHDEAPPRAAREEPDVPRELPPVLLEADLEARDGGPVDFAESRGRGEGGRARAKDDRDDPAEGPPVHVASARKRIRGERRQNAAMPGEEARRAHGRWELQVPERAPLSGEGDLEVTDDAVSAGGVSVEHLDAEATEREPVRASHLAGGFALRERERALAEVERLQVPVDRLDVACEERVAAVRRDREMRRVDEVARAARGSRGAERRRRPRG
jgi:hypothetical protein